jgi:hypothetical protein
MYQKPDLGPSDLADFSEPSVFVRREKKVNVG